MQEPPQIAPFIAWVMLGGALPAPGQSAPEGALVRMSPQLHPVRDAAGDWHPPAGLDAARFASLRDLLTRHPDDPEAVATFALDWIADRVPNQAIRADRNLHCEIGHATFSAARAAWIDRVRTGATDSCAESAAAA